MQNWLTNRISMEAEQLCEPRHDKTNDVPVRPAKTQISLGICPVLSESSLCAQWVAKDPRDFSCGQWRLWSDWADAQADLSLRLAHSHFVGFVMSRLMCLLNNVRNILTRLLTFLRRWFLCYRAISRILLLETTFTITHYGNISVLTQQYS